MSEHSNYNESINHTQLVQVQAIGAARLERPFKACLCRFNVWLSSCIFIIVQAAWHLLGSRACRTEIRLKARSGRFNNRGIRLEFLEKRQLFAGCGINEFPPVLNPIADLTISSGTADGVLALMANDPDVCDTLTFGATAQSIEYYLDQTLGFEFSGGNEYLNYFGLNEKWLTSVSGKWYYILPNGNLYNWSGGPLSNDPLVEQPNS